MLTHRLPRPRDRNDLLDHLRQLPVQIDREGRRRAKPHHPDLARRQQPQGQPVDLLQLHPRQAQLQIAAIMVGVIGQIRRLGLRCRDIGPRPGRPLFARMKPGLFIGLIAKAAHEARHRRIRHAARVASSEAL